MYDRDYYLQNDGLWLAQKSKQSKKCFIFFKKKSILCSRQEEDKLKRNLLEGSPSFPLPQKKTGAQYSAPLFLINQAGHLQNNTCMCLFKYA